MPVGGAVDAGGHGAPSVADVVSAARRSRAFAKTIRLRRRPRRAHATRHSAPPLRRCSGVRRCRTPASIRNRASPLRRASRAQRSRSPIPPPLRSLQSASPVSIIELHQPSPRAQVVIVSVSGSSDAVGAIVRRRQVSSHGSSVKAPPPWPSRAGSAHIRPLRCAGWVSLAEPPRPAARTAASSSSIGGGKRSFAPGHRPRSPRPSRNACALPLVVSFILRTSRPRTQSARATAQRGRTRSDRGHRRARSPFGASGIARAPAPSPLNHRTHRSAAIAGARPP